MKPPSGWEDLLNGNESILWQGTPSEPDKWPIFTLLVLLVLGGYNLVQMTARIFDNNGDWFYSFIFVLVSFSVFFAIVWEIRNEHKNTWYTLTNKRAFIAKTGLFRKKTIKFYPITEFTEIAFDKGEPATILFAIEQDDNRAKEILDTGFKNILGGEKVYDLIQQIQKGTA